VRIAIIPARGGSVRVPRKNIRPFFGKPIIAYSIEVARSSGLFDQVIVSTDDVEIAAIANDFGADALMRPAGWDDIGTQEVGARVIESMYGPGHYPQHACVIYATCPMLTPEYLHAGWAELRSGTPVFAFAVGTDPLRDAGVFYWGEGWAFVRRVPLIGSRTVMVPMPESRVCDINTEDDWHRAERMYEAISLQKAAA
jgi:pseudaminic acid cytidylyltransferase